MTNHPITPPPELVAQWTEKAEHWEGAYEIDIATQAAQWGADQELEACCDWLHKELKLTLLTLDVGLRAARRPKPPSLKEQGLVALKLLKQRTTDPNIIEPLTRALEALPND
jgi:hypothetical protein